MLEATSFVTVLLLAVQEAEEHQTMIVCILVNSYGVYGAYV